MGISLALLGVSFLGLLASLSSSLPFFSVYFSFEVKFTSNEMQNLKGTFTEFDPFPFELLCITLVSLGWV